jgi:hypothetical protein
MIRRRTHPLDVTLEGPVEEVRQNLDRRLRELADAPAVDLQALGEFTLPDGVLVRIGHRLGRLPKLVLCSPPRGAATTGRIDEVRDGLDRSRFVGLRATGFGATIRVDVGVL